DTFIVDTEYGAVQTDTVFGGNGKDTADAQSNGYDTIFVPPSSQKNDITVCVNHNAADYQAVINVSGVTTQFIIEKDDIDEIQISGGDGDDRLNFQYCGDMPNDVVVVYRPGPEPRSGSITVIDSTGKLVEPAVTFDGVEQIELLNGNLTRPDGSSRLVT